MKCSLLNHLQISLRNQSEFTVRPMKIVHYGLNFLAYLGPATNHLKRLESVEAFKSKIKSKVMQI